MTYGRFTRSNDAYVVTRFDTPRPWLNFITNDVYGVCFSQTGHGFSFYKSVAEVRINYIDIFGYVPTHPQSGKFIYLHDADSGRSWPAFPMHSDRGYRGYRCEHGQGYSRLTARRSGIETDFLLFVPINNDPVEIWQVTLTNRTRRPRRIKAYAFQQWHLTCPSGITDTLTYTRADYREDLDALVARMTNPTSPFMYDAFMAADFQAEHFDCRLATFLGPYGQLADPAMVRAGSGGNSSASGEPMCAVLSNTFPLAPGEHATFLVLAGVSLSDEQIQRYKKEYLALWRVEETFAAVRSFWADVRGRLTCRTPSAELDRNANSWLKWQNLLTARWCRGDYKGFRDVLQDVMGICPLEPRRTRRWLLECLKHQYASGLCVRGWSQLTGRLDGRLHRDSPVWVPLTLSAYLRETGRMELLDESVPYLDGGAGTVFEHTMTAMRRLHEERADNGLCLIGDGDWNDSLDEVAPEGRGQSVWLTIAGAYAMRTLEQIARHAGRTADADRLAKMADELTAAVNTCGWDGGWYLYAIGDDGARVGSAENAEGRVHLNAQTWAIFADVATGDRLATLLDLIDRRLETRLGPVLIDPAYSRYVKGIGKVSGKNPGQAENGPIYSHGAAFKILADLHVGRGTKAFETYCKLLPSNPDNPPERFEGEPFAAHRYLIGPACPPRFGASPYSHFTAWPAWTFQLIFERMLGVMPWYDGLRIDPCIPTAWDGYRVVRPWRGATYQIDVRNPDHVERGVAEIRVDRKKLAGNLVPIFSDGTVHKVRVVMG